MAGFFTPGLTPATPAAFTPSSLIPADTELGQGINPQSVAATPAQVVGAGNSPIVITYASAVALDANLNNAFSLVMGAGNAALTISNAQPGQLIQGLVTQDGTGSRLLTIANGAGGTTIVSGTPLSTSAGYVDLIGIMNVGTYALPLFAVWPIAKHFV